MPEIEANWTISLCAAEETNYILCRLDSRPLLTYQTTNNQLIMYLYIEHKLVNKKKLSLVRFYHISRVREGLILYTAM